MKKHTAFTMLELIFVIVIMGIIGKFGVEFIAKAYKSFIFSQVNSDLQSKSEIAVDTIATRLKYRIKDSVIARTSESNTSFVAIADASGDKYKVLEWIGSAQESFRGISDDNTTDYLPDWSGILDLDEGNKTVLISPETNTTKVNQMISDLNDTNTTIDDAALYFIGADSDVQTGYGWIGQKLTDQSGAMHPIKHIAGKVNAFTSSNSADFSGIDVYEYYKLAWTAYAIVYEPETNHNDKGTLYLYYDYQPWNGETMADGNKTILMEDVSTFRFMAIGSIMKIQVCTKSDLVEEYSLCKEQTIF